MKKKIIAELNDIVEIKLINKKGEYSIFSFKVTNDCIQGDEPELFLKKTTGFDVD